jgi:O-antigen/teichoic acid export membrane protein
VKKKIEFIKNNFLKHELVSGSLFIFSGSIFGNIFAFLLNLFLARNFSYADYAIFASLLSIITLAAIPVGSMNTVIVKFATDFFVKKQNDRLKSLYLLFFKFVLGISLLIILLFLIFSDPLKEYLKIDNVWCIIVTGFVIASYYLNTLNNAFLQGMLKFKFISFLSIFGSFVKLIFGVGLVFAGYRVFGGLGALFAMAFGTYLMAFVPLTKLLKGKASGKRISLNVRQIIGYAIPTFITILFMTSFTSTDVILVKHFFNPQVAGLYAGLSLMGKVIFYFTAPIPMVMFPLLVKRHSAGTNFNNLFYLALLLVIVPAVAITAFYFIFPNFAINFFLGGRDYLTLARYLGIFGLYLTIFSMVNICVSFFLSLSKTKIYIPVVIAAISQVVLIYVFHSDFYQVIGVSLLVLAVLLVFLLYLFYKSYWKFGNLKNYGNLNAPSV